MSAARRPNFKGASELPPDQADQRRQEEVSKSMDAMLPPWVRDGRFVSATTVDATELSVTHGLKRIIKGWLLFSVSGDADRICLVQIGADVNVLKLKNTGATGALSFTLWVF